VKRTHLRNIVLVVLVLVAASAAWAQQNPATQGFVPVNEVPPGEQIPAIGLVASAYGFVFVALVAYVWSLASRLKKVEREIGQLEQRSH
jgi:CcmD family protein